LYGKLPTKKNVLGNKFKDRKFFDSGDYVLSRAGKDNDPGVQVGQQHPTPDNIPHNLTSHPGGATTIPSFSSGSNGSSKGQIGSLSGSPVKEPSLLSHRPDQTVFASGEEEQRI